VVDRARRQREESNWSELVSVGVGLTRAVQWIDSPLYVIPPTAAAKDRQLHSKQLSEPCRLPIKL
jgi:hypothetical protein